MAKYIENKKIDPSKSNNVKDLQGIGEAAWKFVSAFYTARWDSLIADVHNNTFRQKVSYNCTLKTNPIKNGKAKKKDTDKPASIERLSPPIPTKTPRKRSTRSLSISKYRSCLKLKLVWINHMC